MELLTPRQAAARLGVSYPALKQWIYRGQLKAVKTPGGHYRIPAGELERLGAKGAPAVGAAASRVSGRNQLRGVITSIRRDGLLAAVTLAIGDQKIQAVITGEAVDALGLAEGMEATALIKATEVMVMR
ncbi:MAG: TOBE domain-containing protein [Terriglobales bacterium]